MAATIKNYLNDGAHPSARAILMLMQWFDIEESWSDERKEYLAEIKVARWENCREQGYVLTLIAPYDSKNKHKQLNIAFFQHRNSDSNHAIRWVQDVSINTPTIDNAQFGDVYKDKYDTSHSTSYNEIYEMSVWIQNELKKFWIESAPKKKEPADQDNGSKPFNPLNPLANEKKK